VENVVTSYFLLIVLHSSYSVFVCFGLFNVSFFCVLSERTNAL